MLRTNSKSTVIIPTSDSSQGKPIGAGNAQKKGQPAEIKNGLFDFDFGPDFEGGEPQTLHSDTNLSLQVDAHSASGSSVETSNCVIPGYVQDSIENSHLDAIEGDSSSEEAEPAPSPKPLQTTAGSAPPAPQFSDDPAIAALQKSQLENTKSVVSYTESLDILNQALADNPTLPRNSFDFVRKILSDGLKRCTDRAQELSDGAQQALDAHAEQARRLAAGAQGDGVAVSEGDETFSMDSIGTVTDADLDHELNVLKGLVSPSAHQRVETAVKTALNGGLESVDQDLATLYQQVNEEAEKAQQQQENDEQLAQLAAWHGNNAAQLDDLFSQLEANIQEEADRDFDEELDDALAYVEGVRAGANQVDQLDQLLNDLDGGLTTPSQVTSLSTKNADSTQPAQPAPTNTGPVDLTSVQNNLLAEAELLLEQEQKEKAALSKVTSPQHSSATQSELKPPALSDDVLRKIGEEAFRYRTLTLDALNAELELVKKRQLTKSELKSPGLAADEAKRQSQAVIARYYQEQQGVVRSATQELNAIKSNEVMEYELPSQRLKRVAELEEKRQTALNLIDTMSLMIYRLWN
ncbi:MAG: hypothetical protein GTN84_13555 [Hydrogenophaga sp.]|uniref:hypothetical protein n=1 Tax=Hydrogenophaga sp. TaxID=1904254 RepID=UPI00168DDA4B|nr:hypothetical protein [Hydrogenophaga sp.]NIM42153.1 hypothetical protein [Hydrogenophaga sp.]NIN27446.1 hypothetical protein [Hydrogenophaga sp.]NIN32147.1 hypothetical protein [Hydrogenophaga sp.]NIN56399.1 hypothetical protein [Hydrogenophaga sp.]NIO52706.1 hypothetical protein [Hydrogenophaga sp.]